MTGEKDVDVSKFYFSWLYLGMSFFKLGVLLDNFEYNNVYFFIGRPRIFKYIWRVVFNKLYNSLFLVFVLDYLSSLSILELLYYMYIEWHYLLHLTSYKLNVKKSY